MADAKELVIRELSTKECLAELAEHHFGRLAYSFRDRVDIEPISYVLEDGWLYARTSHGAKLRTVQHHPYVAFEIDDVRAPTDWTSVVVRGTIYFIDPERGETEAELHERALGVLRSLDAGILTEADVAPYRTELFRIHVDELTGRQASLG